MHPKELPSVIDSRLRRLARKHGFSLRRSRKGISADNLGGYMIVDPENGWVVDGTRFDLADDYVEAWLATLEGPADSDAYGPVRLNRRRHGPSFLAR